MLGTIVNACAILVGSTFGSILRTGIGERYKKALFDALGLCCLVLGANAALPNMARSEYPVLFIVSLAIGSLVGTRLDLAGRIAAFGERKEKTLSPTLLPRREWGFAPLCGAAATFSRNSKDPSRLYGEGEKREERREGDPLDPSLKGMGKVNGLVTGILLFCIGTFSIVGPVLSALSPSGGWALGEEANTFLYTNATLDLVSSAVLAASYGRIMLLAAPVLFCWQGFFYALAYFFGDAMPEPMRVELSIVGGVLIISSGLSILNIKDCKTVNLLPSLLVPVLFYLIK